MLTNAARRTALAMLVSAAAGLAATKADPQRRVPGETVQVNLVLLDVVVTDRKGNPIPGIPAEDFSLLVDGDSVPIDAVEPRGPAFPADGEPAAGPADPDTASQPREFIVLFDMAHLTATARRDAIRATMEFVDEMMTGTDRMMVLAFLRGLHIVSRFTSDHRTLRASLERLAEDPGLTSADAFEETVEIERILDSRKRAFFAGGRRLHGAPPTEEYASTMECIALGRQAEFETARALRAFANMMPAFGGMDGRKALVLFTETLRETPALPYLKACNIPVLEQQVFSDLTARAG